MRTASDQSHDRYSVAPRTQGPLGCLPSQLALLTSLTAYPTLLRLLSGPNPTPTNFSAAIKTVSTIHSSLLTALALSVLQKTQWSAPAPSLTQLMAMRTEYLVTGCPDDSANPTIQGQSELANAITAIECGYLIQDSVALVLSARLYKKVGISGTLDKTLLAHHIGIGTALLILHLYIRQGREKGIYIIVQFLLMNASTPILNLRWYIRTFKPDWKTARLLADGAFVPAFFAARVWLVGKILGDYGAWHGWTAWEAFRYGLRMPCQLGTGALWAANVGWWSVLVWNVASRSTRLTLGGQ